MLADNTLFVLLFILALGLLLPEFLRKFRLPLITFIILAGAITGPHGLGYVQPNETIEFLGFLGMAFLMLIAGVETNVSQLKSDKYKILILASLNGLIPFFTGLFITKFFGYGWTASLLVGIVFISSSIAVIVPSLQNRKALNKKTAQLVLSAVMVTDIMSLIALSFFFQNVGEFTDLPLIAYFLVLIVSVGFLYYFIPRVSRWALKRRFSKDEGLERRIRFMIIILVAILAYFSLLGMHPILAAFLAGVSLSAVIKEDETGVLYTKLHTMGYGLFVPVFFFITGMEVDISLLKDLGSTSIIMVVLIIGLMCSKFFSGYLGGRLVKLSKSESKFFGSISMTQLTTTLAVTYAASSLGLLDSVLTTAIILLSIVSTLVGPWLANYCSKNKC